MMMEILSSLTTLNFTSSFLRNSLSHVTLHHQRDPCGVHNICVRCFSVSSSTTVLSLHEGSRAGMQTKQSTKCLTCCKTRAMADMHAICLILFCVVTGYVMDLNDDGDPKLLDDSEFYQQLLKEFFESCDLTSSEMTFYALKRLQPNKRKIVDHRASKSRKIREIHVEFTTFVSVAIPCLRLRLFCLFTRASRAGMQTKQSTKCLTCCKTRAMTDMHAICLILFCVLTGYVMMSRL